MSCRVPAVSIANVYKMWVLLVLFCAAFWAAAPGLVDVLQYEKIRKN